VNLRPGSANVYNQRCFVRAEQDQDLGAALADCDKSLAMRPNDASTLDSRGFVRFRMGDNAAAIRDLSAALAAEPKLAPSLYIRGLARRKSGDPAGGNADVAAAKAIDPRIAETYAACGVTP
jgi:tetratricopeptide (TPR) repeat protein